MNKGRVEHRGTPTPDLSRFDGPSGTPPKAQEENQDFGPQEKVSEMDPMPGPAAKERAKLDNLFMLGYVEEEVKIADYTFKLRTLTNRENQEVASMFSRINENETELFSINDIILAYSILSVNDLPLNDLYAGELEGVSVVDQKIEVIKRLQQPVVNKLASVYKEMSNKSAKGISEEDLKK